MSKIVAKHPFPQSRRKCASQRKHPAYIQPGNPFVLYRSSDKALTQPLQADFFTPTTDKRQVVDAKHGNEV